MRGAASAGGTRCLPPEDYRSVAERAILREILVGVVFRTVFERVAQLARQARWRLQ
jgi:hypothetical protein